ncbi:MAG: hypothetical protein IJA29_05190, partial [Lachnospiraceae bacterium]|nr:hypothetical protein [Lachnospiraceae bacterium]
NLMTEPTEYAIEKGYAQGDLICAKVPDYMYETTLKEWGYSEDCLNTLSSSWWLRSPAYSQTSALYIQADGGLCDDEVNYMVRGIRPVMWIITD